MKHEKLSDALGQISDRHIAEAAKSKRRFPWAAAVAAVLAVAILLGTVLRPGTQPEPVLQNPISPTLTLTTQDPEPHAQWQPAQPAELLSSRYAITTAQYPQLSAHPLDEGDQEGYTQWRNDQNALHDQPKGYADSLQACWKQLLPALLDTEQGKNTACSPLNVYMALAMLAECTDGQSRRQLLDLMNADSIEALRTQANRVWRAHYNDDGLTKSVLGSSLWLEKDYGFDPDTVDLLAENYYASVFQGDLGSAEMNKALQSWLNEQTEGLLSNEVEKITLDPGTVLSLATTVNYQVQWANEFHEENNRTGIFHGARGDSAQTFMRTTLLYGPYYWSKHFSATSLPLEDGGRMWLILPDAGVAPESIVEEVTEFLSQVPDNYENMKRIRVNLSIPKFDVSADMELAGKLQAMGITDIFDPKAADFSPILPENDGGAVSEIKHAARVLIDEKGVTAAAFTLIMRYGAAEPPEDEVDFTLDRPFLFCVQSEDYLPLFAGIVNEP